MTFPDLTSQRSIDSDLARIRKARQDRAFWATVGDCIGGLSLFATIGVLLFIAGVYQ